MILTSALVCLALNTYHEGRGDGSASQLGSALVTFNRAERNPEKVCETVFKKKQFSWTNGNGKILYPEDRKAWYRANNIAQAVLTNTMYDITDGAKFYHTQSVKPHWAKVMKKTTSLGTHVFYKPKDKEMKWQVPMTLPATSYAQG